MTPFAFRKHFAEFEVRADRIELQFFAAAAGSFNGDLDAYGLAGGALSYGGRIFLPGMGHIRQAANFMAADHTGLPG